MSADPTPPADPVNPPPTAPAAPAPPAAPVSSPGQRRKRPLLTRLLTGRHYDDQIVVYRHSNLFYWWPVWFLGFVCAIVTYFGDRHMAIVPGNTVAAEDREVEIGSKDGKPVFEKRHVLILDAGKKLHKEADAEGKKDIVQPTIRVAPHRTVGTVYVFVLMLVILVTTISLRGLWSVLVIMSLILLTIILYLAHGLGTIFHSVAQLSIYINMGGYLLISFVLFALWALNFFILDRMTYMIFTPGQVRVRLEVGGGEMVYDASGISFQKQRADVLRHFGLGFGSGDLLIFPASVDHAIEMSNVLRVGRVVREIEQLIKEKVVVGVQG